MCHFTPSNKISKITISSVKDDSLAQNILFPGNIILGINEKTFEEKGITQDKFFNEIIKSQNENIYIASYFGLPLYVSKDEKEIKEVYGGKFYTINIDGTINIGTLTVVPFSAEFEKYFPNINYKPIIRDLETNKYWINEKLLNIDVNNKKINIKITTWLKIN